MKTATVNELKQELAESPASELLELCMRLARFKKENKELLTYLVFEADDETGYIQSVKDEMDSLFEEVNKSSLYFAKKTIRKILRIANKHVRFTGSKQAEAELLLYFCLLLKNSSIEFEKSTALLNLYNAQFKKIAAAISSMHEDLQYDYKKQLDQLK